MMTAVLFFGCQPNIQLYYKHIKKGGHLSKG